MGQSVGPPYGWELEAAKGSLDDGEGFVLGFLFSFFFSYSKMERKHLREIGGESNWQAVAEISEKGAEEAGVCDGSGMREGSMGRG